MKQAISMQIDLAGRVFPFCPGRDAAAQLDDDDDVLYAVMFDVKLVNLIRKQCKLLGLMLWIFFFADFISLIVCLCCVSRSSV